MRTLALLAVLLATESASAEPAIDLLEVRPLASSAEPTLWQDGEVGLYWLGDPATLTSSDLYLARLLPGTAVAEQLRDSPVYYFAGDGRPGFAVVHLSDSLARDHLAAELHTQNQACGALQKLTPTSPRQSLFDTSSPIHEPEKLDSVQPLLDAVSAASIMAAIERLEQMGTRHHRVAPDVATKIEAMACEAVGATAPCDLTLERVQHAGTQQESLVLTLPGDDDDETTVILGAHIDSISPDVNDAPGADDDASGVAALLEVLRVVHQLDLRFARRLELHFYAAEEVGLIGSADIAGRYADQGRTVSAMLQSDMNGYARDPGDRTIHLVENGTDAALRAELTALARIYLDSDARESILTAGTSDHRSWHQRGYPAAFAGEDPHAFNPNIHTPDDVSAVVDAELSAHFVRLNLAFVAHHAGLLLPETPDPDLFVAVLETDRPGRYDVAVAAGATSVRIEGCGVPDTGTATCVGSATELEWNDTRGDRTFFINRVDEPFPLRTGSRLLLRAFDETGAMSATRMVRLREPY